jgi:hypothetical protein
MTSPRILILEDDQIQADDLIHRLDRLGSPVDLISTEAQFRKRLRDGDVKVYSLAIVDMMLRWTDPAPDMEPPPQDVIEEGSYTAGLRCCRALASKGVRCIVFTALSPSAIPRKPGDEFEIIHKGGDGYATLFDRIRQPGR